jgi:hypothetical protein
MESWTISLQDVIIMQSMKDLVSVKTILYKYKDEIYTYLGNYIAYIIEETSQKALS